MTKPELVAQLKSKGQWDTHRKTPEWTAAFSAHNTANPHNTLSANCGSCYPKLKTWLLN